MRRTLLALPILLSLAPPALADDTAEVVRGSNRFALEAYGKVREKDKNLFFSPFSVETALAMTSAGARGKTLEQVQHALHLPAQEKLHPALGAYLKRLNGPKKKYQLSVANALWAQKGYPFERAFVDLNRKDYDAGLQEVDFLGDREAARQTINAWVEKKTHDRIKELVPPGVLTADTRLVLTNAIYLKAPWASAFQEAGTHDRPFTLAGGATVKVPLMRQEGYFPYAEVPGAQLVELPYLGRDLGLVVVLPRKADGLDELEKGLSADKLTIWVANLRGQQVDLSLPRFKVTSALRLKKPLTELGMALAFEKGADFSGIVRPGKGERLLLSEVLHKAFVDINEQGTEAAAATAAVTEVVVPAVEPPTKVVFRADRPFLFLIRDTKTGAILFLGRLANPSKGEP